jgi:hypothetical protein
VSSRWVLVLGDVTALALFGALGLASHEKSAGVETVARSILPFIIAWLAIGGLSGMFGAGAARGSLDPGRFVLAWLAAGVAGMVARSIIFDRELFSAFFVIGIAGNGLFLAAWRFVYGRWLCRPRRDADGPVPSERTV